MINYVRRAMKIAVNLESVFLYDRFKCDKCCGKLPNPSLFPPEWNQGCVKKIITNGVNSSAIIHFQDVGTSRAYHLEKLRFY
jgi:hypothetical protein